MQTLSDIRSLLESKGLSPRKTFGQNFLIDHNLIRKLVDAAAVSTGDTILEVGPGTGALTEEFLARGANVIAAEIDRGLAALLRERFTPNSSNPQSTIRNPQSHFSLIEGDCLQDKRHFSEPITKALGAAPFKLVSNLPYGAATPVMSVLLTDYPQCPGLFVTIQREVADRLTAKPGTKDYGTLSVIAQVAAEVHQIAVLPPECFWPRPDVTSAMVSLKRRERPLVENVRAFGDFCQQLFEKRRKQLGAVLGRSRQWPEGIAPTDRAESLSIEQLISLFRAQPELPGA
jgi:16S rRNA (adenine1518-N6/adenine1519-N6)-dimethyltransferase